MKSLETEKMAIFSFVTFHSQYPRDGHPVVLAMAEFRDQVMGQIAALYVATGGPYYGLPGVDPWDEARDARGYSGPWPVVAHPPCARWGRYWSGGPTGHTRHLLGDDGGCFEAALAAVRHWGGVLEHPEASHAWRVHGLNRPPRNGGWVNADWRGGWTCCVEQGHYGHRARKATWLLVYRAELPSLIWGPSSATLHEGYTAAEWRSVGVDPVWDRLSRRERRETPVPFRDLLLGMARTGIEQALRTT